MKKNICFNAIQVFGDSQRSYDITLKNIKCPLYVLQGGRNAGRKEGRNKNRKEGESKAIKLVRRIIDEMGSSIARYKDVMDHLL